MSLPVYFAPLEGLTDATFRQIHHARFSGVTKYFIPFISPTQNLVFNAKELRAIGPEVNAGLFAVPQILCKDPDQFLWAAQELAAMGYPEINLNLGCPSGTVTGKGKGSGMLRDPSALESFLDAIFAKTPVPISVKTRVGYASSSEFARLLEIFNRYPIHELIIHPRTRTEFYKGHAHRKLYFSAQEETALPLVYNGDLFTAADCRDLEAVSPKTCALMLGRGLVANPALAQAYLGGAALNREALAEYHNALYDAYRAQYPEHVVLGRMRSFMAYISWCFADTKKPLKLIWKAQHLDRYEEGVKMMFEDCAFDAEHPNVAI